MRTNVTVGRGRCNVRLVKWIAIALLAPRGLPPAPTKASAIPASPRRFPAVDAATARRVRLRRPGVLHRVELGAVPLRLCIVHKLDSGVERQTVPRTPRKVQWQRAVQGGATRPAWHASSSISSRSTAPAAAADPRRAASSASAPTASPARRSSRSAATASGQLLRQARTCAAAPERSVSQARLAPPAASRDERPERAAKRW